MTLKTSFNLFQGIVTCGHGFFLPWRVSDLLSNPAIYWRYDDRKWFLNIRSENSYLELKHLSSSSFTFASSAALLHCLFMSTKIECSRQTSMFVHEHQDRVWSTNFGSYTNFFKNQRACREREFQQYLLRRVRSQFQDVSFWVEFYAQNNNVLSF